MALSRNPFCLFTRPLNHAMVQRGAGGLVWTEARWSAATASSSRPSFSYTRARFSGPSGRFSLSTWANASAAWMSSPFTAAIGAFEEETYAVVIPSLPFRDGGGRVGRREVRSEERRGAGV